MSGGSWDYLYRRGADDLVSRSDTIFELADRLESLGYANDAAADTRALAEKIVAFSTEVNAIMSSRMSDLWHGIEWWDSSDIGEDGFKNCLAEYRSAVSKISAGKPEVKSSGISNDEIDSLLRVLSIKQWIDVAFPVDSPAKQLDGMRSVVRQWWGMQVKSGACNNIQLCPGHRSPMIELIDLLFQWLGGRNRCWSGGCG